MRLPALAAATVLSLSITDVALAQSSDNGRDTSSNSISAEERATQLAGPVQLPPRFPALAAPVRPIPVEAPVIPPRRKLTLQTMPWLTGAYN